MTTQRHVDKTPWQPMCWITDHDVALNIEKAKQHGLLPMRVRRMLKSAAWVNAQIMRLSIDSLLPKP